VIGPPSLGLAGKRAAVLNQIDRLIFGDAQTGRMGSPRHAQQQPQVERLRLRPAFECLVDQIASRRRATLLVELGQVPRPRPVRPVASVASQVDIGVPAACDRLRFGRPDAGHSHRVAGGRVAFDRLPDLAFVRFLARLLERGDDMRRSRGLGNRCRVAWLSPSPFSPWHPLQCSMNRSPAVLAVASAFRSFAAGAASSSDEPGRAAVRRRNSSCASGSPAATARRSAKSCIRTLRLWLTSNRARSCWARVGFSWRAEEQAAVTTLDAPSGLSRAARANQRSASW